ncbi:hypothetical protein G8O24_28060 [Bradyrhizobium sp. INPA01-394B]|uniref:DUF3618 domain-containing protein n=1 Tax=Bradyrhizobium campsiandrae TaxID=1729892 RepID=A0ABR7UCZ7_9BRAD|nr:hypothetical protein [Bradyrhizobium campsiandrae]MBC9881190.1 hypothetical protein [Bradyrhizobium campsiandrae]MBC9981829.1 hypothetical protein [Bradyrhizobium campsiandrae]
MDMKEASAMTEASGLTNDDGKVEQAPARKPVSGDTALRLADQLRELTVKAPLRSLLVAFLLGRWIARRR